MQMQRTAAPVASAKMAFAPLGRRNIVTSSVSVIHEIGVGVFAIMTSEMHPRGLVMFPLMPVSRMTVAKYSKFEQEAPELQILKQKGTTNAEVWGPNAVWYLAAIFFGPIFLYLAYWFVSVNLFGVTECYKWPLTE